jgi:hypothetical protein
MSSLEKLRHALVQAEERHADLARQCKELEFEVARKRVDLEKAQDAYVRALERELEDRPLPVVAAAQSEDLWDEPGPDFQLLVIQSSSSDAGPRAVARRALDRMGPKAIDPLLAMLSHETALWEKRINVVCGALVTLIVAAILQLPALADFPAGYGLMLLSLPFLVAYAKPLGPHKRAAEALARIDNVRVVGPLIDALALDDPVIQWAASGALVPLLRRMRPGDESNLSESQWQALFHAFDRVGKPDFAIAALRAAEQAGDERLIPLVAPLAEGKGAGGLVPEIRRIARDCLEVLADLSLRGRAGRDLLRPSFDPNSHDGSLLRAACASNEADEQILLRTAVEGNACELGEQ